MHPDDTLSNLIKQQIDALPRWCKGLPGDHETHDWVLGYGDISPTGIPDHVHDEVDRKYGKKVPWRQWVALPEIKEAWFKYGSLLTRTTQMFPYYVCRHCHAVSSDFTTTPPDQIKRVR